MDQNSFSLTLTKGINSVLQKSVAGKQTFSFCFTLPSGLLILLSAQPLHKAKDEGTLDNYHQSTALTFTMEETEIERLWSGLGHQLSLNKKQNFFFYVTNHSLSIFKTSMAKRKCCSLIIQYSISYLRITIFERQHATEKLTKHKANFEIFIIL